MYSLVVRCESFTPFCNSYLLWKILTLAHAGTTFSKVCCCQVWYGHHCSPIITLLHHASPVGRSLWPSGQSHWPLPGTILEHCVTMVCRAPHCVTMSSEGDTMTKNGIDWCTNTSGIKVKTQHNSWSQKWAGAVLCSKQNRTNPK